MARAMGLYEPPLLELIHEFKYRKNRTLGLYLGKMMAETHYADLDFEAIDLLIPVPLHNQKLRQRTFNQALILAREVARRHGKPVNHSILKRTFNTPAQVTLRKEERKKNVKGAFSLLNPEEIKNKNILLLDDVYTTGGTVNECARLLIDNGAKNVYVLTLARTI